MDIAAGEYGYHLPYFQQMLAAEAVDCLQADVTRALGITGVLKVAALCDARGMDLYASEHLPPDHPKRLQKYINGDVNSSLIRTVNGLTIILKHDTDLPRPYSRTHLVQGTRGIVRRFPEFQVCLEGKDHNHLWKPGATFLAEYIGGTCSISPRRLASTASISTSLHARTPRPMALLSSSESSRRAPVASPVSVANPKRTRASYSFTSLERNCASRVARPTSTPNAVALATAASAAGRIGQPNSTWK